MRILITGAAAGLGLALSKVALSRGHVVYAAQNKNSVYPKDILEKMSLDKNFHLLKMDVSQEAQVQDAVSKVEEKETALDCIINNAGILRGRGQTIENINFEELRKSFEVNAFGAVQVTQKFFKLLENGQNQSVINISSESASITRTKDRDYAYCMSKAAMNMFSEQLRLYVQPKGIRVCAIHPGWMRTPMGGADATSDPFEVAQKILDIAEGKTIITCEPAFIDVYGAPMAL